jgi:hypothetical protein
MGYIGDLLRMIRNEYARAYVANGDVTVVEDRQQLIKHKNYTIDPTGKLILKGSAKLVIL